MVILGLDTTTPRGSVAIMREGRVVEARGGDAGRTHGERLPGDLVTLLETHGLSFAEVDAYAVCSGPGSFTGLRVGLATIQGLALVNHKPVVPVPTLDALSWAAVWSTEGAASTAVGTWMNAHRGEVFAALYRPPAPNEHPSGTAPWRPLVTLVGPTVGPPDVVIAAWREQCRDGRVVVIGDAVDAHRPLLTTELGRNPPRLLTEVPPLAAVAARIAAATVGQGGGVSPYAVHPVYVRRPDAELARERRQRRVDAPKR